MKRKNNKKNKKKKKKMSRRGQEEEGEEGYNFVRTLVTKSEKKKFCVGAR
jgi:hypothetical protein